MTMLRLYNTLSRTKEDFVPLDPKNVRMYVCGPTVYDYAHIGNARPAIVFDVLFRLLRHIYGAGHVTYVRNITDIDDKINARAMERRGDRNVPILEVLRELTEQTYGVYRADVMALGCLEPTSMPRATQYVAQMIAMTGTLIDLGYAYAAEGHVLFRVKKKADYGKLARRSLDDMLAGARVDVAPYKEDPMDFVLWKPSDDQTPGWDSPWGRGRPGWHLECSAMIEASFRFEEGGETIDIHGGGIDLVFPHHENEIAQSEGAHRGHALARYWMHNGFLNVEGEKMSKSLGNFVTINEILRGWRGRAWPGSAVRWAMLQTHYRQPIDWTERLLAEAAVEIQETLNIFRGRHRSKPNGPVDMEEALAVLRGSQPSPALVEALEDDLNVSEAARVIRALKKDGSKSSIDRAVGDLGFLGVIRENDVKYFGNYHVVATDIDERDDALELATNYQTARANNDVEFVKSNLEAARNRHWQLVGRETFELVVTRDGDVDAFDRSIDDLVKKRTNAKQAKDFKEADRIRDELLAQGIVLKDGPTGTTWEVKR